MIRAAIIGLGTWGQNLVRNVQGTSASIRLSAAATRTPEKSRAFADQHGLRMAASYEEVLADPTIAATDATSCAT